LRAPRLARGSVPPGARGRRLLGQILSCGDRFFAISPSGRTLAYTDLGARPDGQDAPEIYLLHLDTGERTQLTHLPPGHVPFPQLSHLVPGDVPFPSFTDERTVLFTNGGMVDRINTDGG